MTVAEAFRIVLDLARQNIIDASDMPEEHDRQVQACAIVEEIADNEYR